MISSYYDNMKLIMSQELTFNNAEPEWSVTISPCGKYELRVKDDPEILVSTDVTGKSMKSKYEIHQVIRRVDDGLIFQYRTLNEISTPLVFFSLDGTDWLLTNLEYMSQLFINLNTGMYYDNCKVLHLLSDNQYVRASNVELVNEAGGFSENEGFIWCSVKIQDDKTALVQGCYWALPYETRKYDLSNISQGWPLLTAEHD
jgi:hypothetical protein